MKKSEEPCALSGPPLPSPQNDAYMAHSGIIGLNTRAIPDTQA